MSVKSVLLSAVLAVQPLGGFADEICYDDAMIVFDGSDSMAYDGFNTLNTPRIAEARQAVRDAIPEIAKQRKLGLVIYGPGRGDTCGNVDLRFEPIQDASQRIINDVDELVPGGMTALTEAVRLAANTLDYEEQTATIVLVTDGQETCGGTPCELADELLNQGHDVIVHVIGFKMRPEIPTFRVPNQILPTDPVHATKCLADQTGGKYLTAETVSDLADAIADTLGCKVYGRQPRHLSETQLAANF